MNCNKITYDKNCNIIINEEYDSNYAYVYILQLNKTTEITSQVFIKTSEDQKVLFDIGLDGFYTLVTLKVPIEYGIYFYSNNKFYHLYEEIELQELIELNPNVTKIETTYDYYFQTCRLRNCFVNICYQIFDTQASINCNNSKLDQNLIYKRDLVWSALNVLKYMVELNQYEEAERLLERIMGCNGLCSNVCSNSYQISKCGCKE